MKFPSAKSLVKATLHSDDTFFLAYEEDKFVLKKLNFYFKSSYNEFFFKKENSNLTFSINVWQSNSWDTCRIDTHFLNSEKNDYYWSNHNYLSSINNNYDSEGNHINTYYRTLLNLGFHSHIKPAHYGFYGGMFYDNRECIPNAKGPPGTLNRVFDLKMFFFNKTISYEDIVGETKDVYVPIAF